MDNRTGEKFNPFSADAEDLSIVNDAEMEEAKRLAGVVSEEEHDKRMLLSGDKGLIKETKRKNLSREYEKIVNSLREISLGKLGTENLRALHYALRAVSDYPGFILRDQRAIADLDQQLGGRHKRTKYTSPILDMLHETKTRLSNLEYELPKKLELAKGLLTEMGLPESITVEEVDRMWSAAETRAKKLEQEFAGIKEKLDELK